MLKKIAVLIYLLIIPAFANAVGGQDSTIVTKPNAKQPPWTVTLPLFPPTYAQGTSSNCWGVNIAMAYPLPPYNGSKYFIPGASVRIPKTGSYTLTGTGYFCTDTAGGNNVIVSLYRNVAWSNSVDTAYNLTTGATFIGCQGCRDYVGVTGTFSLNEGDVVGLAAQASWTTYFMGGVFVVTYVP